MTSIFIVSFIAIFISAFIIYNIQIFFDILLLSLLGFFISKIIGIKFKYKMIFNMSVYSITLSMILLYIYTCVNFLTGFTIKYFEIAYNAIAYIYIITAMLMIKSDLIKQQIEVARIVEEQKKVREESEENREEDKEKEKTEEKKLENKNENLEGKKEKKEKNKKEKGKENPEGSKA